MGTGKERIRRWREKNEKEGKKTITVVISKDAHDILNNEKEKTGKNYGAIVEKARLNMKRPKASIGSVAPSITSNVTSNVLGGVSGSSDVPAAMVRTKQLIDEGDYLTREQQSQTAGDGFVISGEGVLGQGFLPRLLRSTRGRFFKR